MPNLRLEEIPLSNLLKVLRKMDYRTVSRMRKTCHEIDDLVHQYSRHLSFPVDTKICSISCRCPKMLKATNFSFWLSQNEGEQTVVAYLECVRDDVGCHHVAIEKPEQVECARFDTISMRLYDHSILKDRLNQGDLMTFMDTAKIRCRALTIHNGLLDQIDLIRFYRISGASALTVRKELHSRGIRSDNSLSFDMIRQLLAVGCRWLSIDLCEPFPHDYVSILSKFTSFNVFEIVGERPPSLVPLMRLMISDPNSALDMIKVPIYSHFLSDEEIEDLDLGKWRCEINVGASSHPGFLINTEHDYFVLVEHYKSDKYCYCYRISKKLDQLVDWIIRSVFMSMPIDASVLYDYFEENLDHFDLVKEYILKLLKLHSTYGQ